MTDFLTNRTLIEYADSHGKAMASMESAIKNAGEQGVRAVQIYAQAAALQTDADNLASGTKLVTESLTKWSETKVYLAQALDATSQGTGKTRQQLLDEVAALDSTNFGV